MDTDVISASGTRRALAVFIDFFVLFAAWIGFGVAFPTSAIFFALGFLFLVDVVLTTSHGVSIGRWVARIRVAGSDGGPPGIRAVILRTVLVFLTGWIGLFVFVLTLELVHFHLRGSVPSRMWWDGAAGTRLVSA